MTGSLLTITAMGKILRECNSMPWGLGAVFPLRDAGSNQDVLMGT